MRLLARSPHRYYHRAQQQLYLFSAGEIKDVPDEVGQLLLDAHPDRFALVEVEEGTDTSLGTGWKPLLMTGSASSSKVEEGFKD